MFPGKNASKVWGLIFAEFLPNFGGLGLGVVCITEIESFLFLMSANPIRNLRQINTKMSLFVYFTWQERKFSI